MKAIWQGQVVAESDDTVVGEGNHYSKQHYHQPLPLEGYGALLFSGGRWGD